MGRVGKRLVFCLGNSCEIRGLLLCTQGCLLAVKKIMRGEKACLTILPGNLGSAKMGVKFFSAVTPCLETVELPCDLCDVMSQKWF